MTLLGYIVTTGEHLVSEVSDLAHSVFCFHCEGYGYTAGANLEDSDRVCPHCEGTGLKNV